MLVNRVILHGRLFIGVQRSRTIDKLDGISIFIEQEALNDSAGGIFEFHSPIQRLDFRTRIQNGLL